MFRCPWGYISITTMMLQRGVRCGDAEVGCSTVRGSLTALHSHSPLDSNGVSHDVIPCSYGRGEPLTYGYIQTGPFTMQAATG